jgi:stage II sporulation protein D
MRTAAPLLILLLTSSLALAQDVRVGVLGLFHPRELTLSASGGSALVLHAGPETLTLERSSGVGSANIAVIGNKIVVQTASQVLRISELTVAGRDNGPSEFFLAVPGKIKRRYRGTLELKAASGTLVAVVKMDIETAVASVVAAESTSDTPSEALKAQAVAARSYFVAGRGGHHDFDFCDTTHCQFLREPPVAESAAAQATFATRGLVIAYQSKPFPTMYTRSCSGRTRTPAELGLSAAGYPYYPVECRYCRGHPSRWQSSIPVHDAVALRSSDESARLKIGRRLGWSAIPSDDFVMQEQGEHASLQGTGQGHGIGLCQAGAKAMAQQGADFRQILSHYYPNTTIISFERVAVSQ